MDVIYSLKICGKHDFEGYEKIKCFAYEYGCCKYCMIATALLMFTHNGDMDYGQINCMQHPIFSKRCIMSN